MKKTFLSAVIAASAAVFMLTSCAEGEKKTEEASKMAETTPAADTTKPAEPVVTMADSKNIVENASASADHTTLVAAVKAADLVATLTGAGPFTVFAPTNAAFAALPAGTVDNLLKPEMKKDLTGILTYHVVAGAVKAADLKDGQKIKTVQGGELTVAIKDGKVTINGANVTTADIVSSNGVIHVVDAVLMPKK